MPTFSLRIHRLVVCSFIIALVVSFSGQGLAQKSVQNKTLVVVGSAAVLKGDVPAARETAIKEGLLTAVAQMTEEILQVEALVDNFAQVNELVYNHPDKFIRNYKVLTETTSGEFYRVAVQVTVSGKKIAKELSKEDILRAETTLPLVVFLIAEQKVKEILPQYWWGPEMRNFKSVSERAMVEVFNKKGFTVANHRGVQLHKLVDWAEDARPELTNEQATEIGTSLKADVVVVGTSDASESPNIMGYEMKSFKASVTARVLQTETGEKLFAISREAVATNVNEYEGGMQALSSVGNVAGEALAEQLAVEWRKILEKPSKVEIVIEGTNQLANFVKFRKALSSISGVEGIQVKEIKPNMATLIVDFHGKADDLAAALMLKTFETFGIDIYEVTENILKIALIQG
jgi:hypothetical protein